tara:strand:+ start:397 stop:1551 length:1155 start_codon:yes stop_codon:yes gene_type:complete
MSDIVSSELKSEINGNQNIAQQTGETNTPQPATEDATEPKTLSVLNRPIRKIGGGGVLQYPVDLDTDIQDYFEIQIFKYRKASRLPSATTETENSLSGFSSFSNQRGLRQNQRLQELQSTIQLPIPNSVKDNNVVGWGEGEMSGIQGDLMNEIATSLLDQKFEDSEKGVQGIINSIKGVTGDTFGVAKDLINNPQIRRRKTLSMINAATSQLGVGIDVTQALSRFGVVENPNLELLLKGPSLRSFSFNIRFTPRSPEESRVIRMIIRAFKQHSAIKRNGQLGNNAFTGASGSTGEGNYLLGTPDVFKLRYIKAKTQKDIKGLNKFKTCALTGVSVDYTGESGRFSAYDEDSQPVTTIISLSFSELLPIYDTDYSEFTTDDDVGL